MVTKPIKPIKPTKTDPETTFEIVLWVCNQVKMYRTLGVVLWHFNMLKQVIKSVTYLGNFIFFSLSFFLCFLAPVQAHLGVYQHTKRCQKSYLGHKWKTTTTKVGFISVLLVLLVLRPTKVVYFKNSQTFGLTSKSNFIFLWFQSLKSRRLELSENIRFYTNYHRVRRRPSVTLGDIYPSCKTWLVGFLPLAPRTRAQSKPYSLCIQTPYGNCPQRSNIFVRGLPQV